MPNITAVCGDSTELASTYALGWCQDDEQRMRHAKSRQKANRGLQGQRDSEPFAAPTVREGRRCIERVILQ